MFGFTSEEEAREYFVNNLPELQNKVEYLLTLDEEVDESDSKVALVEIMTLDDIKQISNHAIENWEKGYELFKVKRFERF